MTPYLEAHPPRRRQYRAPRREDLSGVVVVHTTESVLDSVGPDTGAERVAEWITRRTTPGSYHDIVDADSAVYLVAYDNEAFHVATHRLNRSAIGLAFACRTTDWDRMSPARRDAFLTSGAAAAARAAAHVTTRTARTVPARRLTLDQALGGMSGFLAHGDADPERRTDPGPKFPWEEFLVAYRQATAPTGGPPIDDEEDDMRLLRIIRNPGEDAHEEHGKIHLVSSQGVGPPLDPGRLSALKAIGVLEFTGSRAQRDLANDALRDVAR